MPITEIARFQVEKLVILDENGKVDEALEPKLDPDRLRELYGAMVRARELDQRMLKLQRQGRIGTFPPATGQEAPAVGGAFALNEKDWLVASYRDLGANLLRGEPMLATLLYHNGYEEGSTLPQEHRSLPRQVILAAQLLHAVGIGYAIKYRKEPDTAVLTYCGDGATSQGDFHEALNYAGVWKAPVVFMVQNNQWAISTPRKIQTAAESIAQKAIAYGMPGIQVDGNDVLAVYKAVSEALERARRGEGPTLIEALTYRLGPHTTADDPKKYRSEEEEKLWWSREPLIRFRKYLEERGVWDAERQTALEAAVKAEVDGAVQELESKTDFKPDASYDHLYEVPDPWTEAQREVFLATLRQEGQIDG